MIWQQNLGKEEKVMAGRKKDGALPKGMESFFYNLVNSVLL